MTDEQRSEDRLLHELANQLAVIIGFADVVLESTTADDARYADLVEIRDAAHAALRVTQDLTRGRSGRGRADQVS